MEKLMSAEASDLDFVLSILLKHPGSTAKELLKEISKLTGIYDKTRVNSALYKLEKIYEAHNVIGTDSKAPKWFAGLRIEEESRAKQPVINAEVTNITSGSIFDGKYRTHNFQNGYVLSYGVSDLAVNDPIFIVETVNKRTILTINSSHPVLKNIDKNSNATRSLLALLISQAALQSKRFEFNNSQLMTFDQERQLQEIIVREFFIELMND
jgi:hypothetical protein